MAVRDHDGELVTAEARDRVLRRQAEFQTAGNLAEKGIADGVAKRVVDRFETIKVQPKERDRVLRLIHRAERFPQALTKVGPVGKLG